MIAGIKMYHRVAGIPGLLVGIIGQLTGHQRLMRVRPPKADRPVFLRVPSTDVATFRQIFLHEDYCFEAIRPPEIIVDAGANIGLAAIYLACKFPNAQIFAIEAESGNFELLKRNVSSYDNITTIHAALWNEETEISLVDPGLGDSGFITQDADNDEVMLGSECHKIRAITMNTLMTEYNLDHIDLLKIDIEGAELEVFENPQPWIGSVDAIVIELHERLKQGCERSFQNGTREFDEQWSDGENVYKIRNKAFIRRSAQAA